MDAIMIRNRFFACYIALAGSLLCIGNIKGSTIDLPEPLVGIIAEYAQEPRVIESSKCVHPTRMPFWRALLGIFSLSDLSEMPRIYDGKYRRSHIDMPNGTSPHIHVHNTYTPKKIMEPNCFTYSFDPNSNKKYWTLIFSGLKIAQLIDYERYKQEEQETNECRNLFGLSVIPDGSSAKYSPRHHMLVVADEHSVTTYKTLSLENFKNTLNGELLPEDRARMRNETLRRALLTGIAITGAAAACAASKSK